MKEEDVCYLAKLESVPLYIKNTEEGDESMKCCICGCEFEGIGNNPEPLMPMEKEGVEYSEDTFEAEKYNRCCTYCDATFVLPVRVLRTINQYEE